MAMNIGGFFATLQLKSDQASFEKSQKDLKSVEDQIRKTGLGFASFVGEVIKGFSLIGGAAIGAAYAVSQIQGKMTLTAKSAGLGYTEMAKWSSTMKTVGLDATTLVSSMGSINKALSDYKVDPEAAADYTKLAERLAALQKQSGTGININDFEKAGSATNRAQLLVNTVQSQSGTSRYQGSIDLAEKIMPGIGDLINALRVNADINKQNKNNALPTTLTGLLSSSPQWQTKTDILNGASNSRTFDKFTAEIDQVWITAGNSFANNFAPIIKDFTNWIEAHKDEIKAFFDGLGKTLASIVSVLSSTFGEMIKRQKWIDENGLKDNSGAYSDLLWGSGGYYDAYKSGLPTKDYFALQDAKKTFSSVSSSLPQSTLIAMDNAYYEEVNRRLGSGWNSATTKATVEASAKQNVMHLYVNVDKSGNVTAKMPDGSLTK